MESAEGGGVSECATATASRCTVCPDLRTRTESFNGETDEFVRLRDERLYRCMCVCERLCVSV